MSFIEFREKGLKRTGVVYVYVYMYINAIDMSRKFSGQGSEAVGGFGGAGRSSFGGCGSASPT